MLSMYALCLLVCLSLQHIIAQQCNSPMYVRRDFRELIDQQNPNRLLPEGEAFMAGVRCLANRQGSSGSVWEDFTSTHMANTGAAHGTAAFFPWHRLFLLSLEKAMRDCTGNQNIYIPYWDAAADSQAPESAAVWRFFGRSGGCITSGLMSQMPEPTVPNLHCLSRQFDSSALPSVESVALLSISTDYNVFKNDIEGSIHAAVHNWIGGDMLNMFSPNDPIFYLHHSNMDRIWAEWQIRYPNSANTYSGNAWGGGQASVNDQLDMVSVKNYIGNRPVSALFSTRNWCYTYSAGGASIPRTNPSNPTTGPTNPTNPGGFPEWRFCSASSQCSSNCCSTRWANDGRMKCHPTSACPNTSPTPNPPQTPNPPTGNSPVWDFCSASNECSSGCCSQRWSNDGKMKCHPSSACPAIGGDGNNNSGAGNNNGGDSTPNPSTGTCGGGNRGNGVCPQHGDCCSTWGWCGTGPQFCAGRVLKKRNLPEQNYNPYQQQPPQGQPPNGYASNPIPQPPQVQQPYQPQPNYQPEPSEPDRYHGNPKNHITPATDDRNDYMNIRKHARIPEEYCIMNNLNVTNVRMTEEKIYSLIEKLNEREDYISPCALINRPKDGVYRPCDPDEKSELEKMVHNVIKDIQEGKVPEKAPQQGPPNQQQGPSNQQGPPNQPQGTPNQQQGPPPQQQSGPAKFYYFAGAPRR